MLRRNTYLRCIINSWMQFDTIRNDAWNRACTARGCCFGLNQTRVYLLLQHFHLWLWTCKTQTSDTFPWHIKLKILHTYTHLHNLSGANSQAHALRPGFAIDLSIKLKDAEVTIDRLSLTLEHAVAADRCVWQPSWLPRVYYPPLTEREMGSLSESA